MEQDVVCDDDDGDDDCIGNHGNNNCNNDDGDMEVEEVTLTDVAGIDDGDGNCTGHYGDDNCDDDDVELEEVTLTDIAGIQAKLYNQDLSLDASFDAGGNMGRFLKTQCFPSHFPNFEQLLLSSQWDHRLHLGLSMDLGGHFAPEHWCLIFVLVIHIFHIMIIMVT